MKIDIRIIKDNSEYEAVYIDGILQNEGNPLNEGIERVLWFIHIADSYCIDIKDIKFYTVNLESCTKYGEFPNELIEIINDIELEGINE